MGRATQEQPPAPLLLSILPATFYLPRTTIHLSYLCRLGYPNASAGGYWDFSWYCWHCPTYGGGSSPRMVRHCQVSGLLRCS